MDNPEGQVTYLNSSSDGRATYRLWHERACVAFLSCVYNDIKKRSRPLPIHFVFVDGIIEDKEDVVVEAVKEAGLEVLEVNHQGEWVSVTARKN